MSLHSSGVVINDSHVPGSSIHLMFCDIANHGDKMQNVGLICDSGFTNENLSLYQKNLGSDIATIYNVKDCLPRTLMEIPDCYVLVIKDYFEDYVDDLWETLMTNEASQGTKITGVNWDSTRIKDGKIINNNLGYKLIFTDLRGSWKYPFSPYDNRGTVYNSNFLPSLSHIQTTLQAQLGYLPVVDGTLYYNTDECFTPLHQVKDRKKLVGLGLGETVPLQFKWFHSNIPCSETMSIPIDHGDLYIISQAAAGIHKEKQTKLFLKYGVGNNKALLS